MQSGRYLETVGWVGANMTAPTQPLQLSRIHIDASRQTLIVRWFEIYTRPPLFAWSKCPIPSSSVGLDRGGRFRFQPI